jgi:hypothetical protein
MKSRSHFRLRIGDVGIVVLMPVIFITCAGSHRTELNPEAATKIRFDLSQLNEDGLAGPPDGRRALHYEFCIPAREELAAEVRRIDTTVQIVIYSPGRIGCTENEFLCMGHTHRRDFSEALAKLALLDYIPHIEQSFFEK